MIISATRTQKMQNFILQNSSIRDYAFPASAKSGAGRSNPELTLAHDRAFAVFLCAEYYYIRIMVGRAGQSSDWPVPMVAGIATPVRLTTHERSNFGGELLKLTIEAAIMATFPTYAHPNPTRCDLIYAACNSQRYLRQLKGFICLLSDTAAQNDSDESWQFSALLTLAHLAC